VLIRITEAGVDVLARARIDRAAVIDPLLEQLTDAERAALSTAVDVMRQMLTSAQNS
jgi:hypothetical protein